jgi:hypothetical protein
VATFLAMDCEATPENRAYASRQGVRAFPTFQIFHRGASIEQVGPTSCWCSAITAAL